MHVLEDAISDRRYLYSQLINLDSMGPAWISSLAFDLRNIGTNSGCVAVIQPRLFFYWKVSLK